MLYAARHKSSLSLWLYNNLLPLNVCLVLRKTPVSIYILVLYIYKQFKSGLAAPPLGEVTCYSVYILTLSFIFFSFIIYRTERWRLIIIVSYFKSDLHHSGLPKDLSLILSDADEFKKSTEANPYPIYIRVQVVRKTLVWSLILQYILFPEFSYIVH